MRRWMGVLMGTVLVLGACDDGDGNGLDPDGAAMDMGAADSDPLPDAGPDEPDAAPDEPDADPAIAEPGELWRVDISANGLIIGTQVEAWFDAEGAAFERATIRAVGTDDVVSDVIGEVLDAAIDDAGGFTLDFGSVTLPPDFNPAGIPLAVVLAVEGRIVDDESWCGTVTGEVPLLMQALDGATFGAAPWPMSTDPFCPGEGPGSGPTVGGDRPAEVLVPMDYDPERSWPLVVSLHGYGASGRVQASYLRLASRVDADGVIMIIPDGTVDGDGERHWQARGCCGVREEVVDDLGYLVGLVDEAADTWNIDPQRVFAIGHSNGGFMAHDLACLADDTFRGIVSLAGSGGQEAFECPGSDVAVLNVHGDADATIRYEGAPWHTGADATVERWVGINGCGEAEDGEALDLDGAVAGAETTTRRWADCAAPVEAWRMVGSGHVPQFDDLFATGIIAWLQASVPAEPPAQSPSAQ